MGHLNDFVCMVTRNRAPKNNQENNLMNVKILVKYLDILSCNANKNISFLSLSKNKTKIYFSDSQNN